MNYCRRTARTIYKFATGTYCACAEASVGEGDTPTFLYPQSQGLRGEEVKWRAVGSLSVSWLCCQGIRRPKRTGSTRSKISTALMYGDLARELFWFASKVRRPLFRSYSFIVPVCTQCYSQIRLFIKCMRQLMAGTSDILVNSYTE